MSGGAGRRAAKQIIIEAAKGTALVRAYVSCIFNSMSPGLNLIDDFYAKLSQLPFKISSAIQGCVVAYVWKIAVYDTTKSTVDNYYKKH